MANQNYGEGQQNDEDITNEQWAKHSGQQEFDEEQVRQGDMPIERPQQTGMGQQASNQDQWDQEHGVLSEEPISPLDEEEEWQEEDVARLDKIE